MVRLFTCVWIPSNLREKIKDFQKEMIKLPMKGKHVEVENLHFTISFLGDVNNRDVNILKDKLNDSIKDLNKFFVRLDGLKLIPNENYIRVIGINVKDEGGEVSNLIKKVASSIGGKFYEKQKLTLCRVKKIHDKKKVRDFIEKNRDIEIGEFEVKSVALVKSTLTRRGALYETIHESPLK
jgi:2'-5' RNA ligase